MKLKNKNTIYGIVQEKEIVSVSELEKLTKIPRTSLLRYLKELSAEGKLIKSFGEVKFRRSSLESNPYPRLQSNKTVKIAIAKKAVKLIKDGDVIFMDGGSTNYFLAKLLAEKKIKIYTNNLLIPKFLDNDFLPEVNLIPGKVNKTTLVAASSASIQFLNNVLFDKVFIGFNSFDGTNFATTNEAEALLKRSVILNTQTKNVFVIGRKGKKNEIAKYIFASSNEVTLITEEH